MSTIQYSIVGSGENETLVVFVPGADQPQVAANDHPNYQAILDGVRAGDSSVVDLFDIGETVQIAFKRLTDRVVVKHGRVLVDGDELDSTLLEQVLDFVKAGEDVTPLLRFWERLESNPLGNVRQGVFDWIIGQREKGALTITPEGLIIGYKAFNARPAELRADEADTVYVSSRPARNGDIVNDVEVPHGKYAEHLPGDTVEMPRSVVLDAPSQDCGVGLHIGTFSYANTFASVVMTAEFDPRDIVSLPDSNSTWKLRVCRYKLLEIVTEPLDVPVYQVHSEELPATDYGDGEYAEDDQDDEDDLFEDDQDDDEEATVQSYHGFPVGVKVRHDVRNGAVGTVIDAAEVVDYFGSVFRPENDIPVREENGKLNGFPKSSTRLVESEAPKPAPVVPGTSKAEFSAGDTIQVINPLTSLSPYAVKGARGVVDSIGDYIRVKLENDPQQSLVYFAPREIGKTSKFHIGDRVEGEFLYKTTTVKDINGNSYLLVFEDNSEGWFTLEDSWKKVTTPAPTGNVRKLGDFLI